MVGGKDTGPKFGDAPAGRRLKGSILRANPRSRKHAMSIVRRPVTNSYTEGLKDYSYLLKAIVHTMSRH